MSGIIQLLPENIANQIAAGEVIQRPASVVKELIENSIDADATKITVNIKDAGKTLIQIVDNGQGMNSADAALCFERHATSKVRTANDLFQLSTKGFRGEALASIAAIAHVTLKTKQRQNDLGCFVEIEGNSIRKQEECVTPDGCSFEIKNLFYNVPARRNFLKSENTEFGHIRDEFLRIALAHPEVNFQLHHNEQLVYNLPAAVLRKRIVDILGKSANEKLVPIEESTDIVGLKGFVLKPEASKRTRGEQYFFVNDRFFKSSYFNHAVNKAFQGMISSDHFPSYFLYLDIDPAKIDVNVHPTKTEIKFEEEKYIYSILLSSIKQALGKYNVAPTLDFEQETSFDIPVTNKNKPAYEPEIKVDTNYNPFKTSTRTEKGSLGKKTENYSTGIMNQGFGTSHSKPEDWENFYSIKESVDEDVQSELIEQTDHVIPQGNKLVRGNFIIATDRQGLVLIHIRRAYEQIIYSDLHVAFVSQPIESQKLLFPIDKELNDQEIIQWSENESLLKQLGFQGALNENNLQIKGVPSVIQEEQIIPALDELFVAFEGGDIDKGEIAHHVITQIARNASKGNFKLKDQEEIDSLLTRLFACEHHTFTSSGKQIILPISLTELENKFK